ncbi:unnamed protein product, partial [Effrenium voratum]
LVPLRQAQKYLQAQLQVALPKGAKQRLQNASDSLGMLLAAVDGNAPSFAQLKHGMEADGIEMKAGVAMRFLRAQCGS